MEAQWDSKQREEQDRERSGDALIEDRFEVLNGFTLAVYSGPQGPRPGVH